MTLFSVIVALALEQLRPLSVRKWVSVPLTRFADFLESKFNDGQYRHGTIVWVLAVAVPTLLAGAFYLALHWLQPVAAFMFAVGVLYLTMGFRQFSHYFSELHLALRMGELDQARRIMAEWRGRSSDRLGSSEIARLAIEQALVASHRCVFAPMLWFFVFGPAGALLYRLALFFNTQWSERSDQEFGRFGEFSRSAFAIIDWLPVRATASAFAIVGDFEDAVLCWRTQAARWSDPDAGILLASGAGALGVRLGMPVREGLDISDRPEIGLGEDADADFMQSAVGLVWRALVLGLLLLTLVWVASWVS